LFRAEPLPHGPLPVGVRLIENGKVGRDGRVLNRP
jgi:hypothetical protein